MDQALPAGSYQLVAGEVDRSADGLQTAMDTYAPTDLQVQGTFAEHCQGYHTAGALHAMMRVVEGARRGEVR